MFSILLSWSVSFCITCMLIPNVQCQRKSSSCALVRFGFSSTPTQEQHITIKLIFKFISLNIPMISESWIVIMTGHSRLEARCLCSNNKCLASIIQFFLFTCHIGYGRQIGLVLLYWYSDIIFNRHIRLLIKVYYKLFTIKLTWTTIKLMIHLRT